tara:strand:- start:174 stop:608 length:435 start_codon:yes stop_codon:yes gene_type:complete
MTFKDDLQFGKDVENQVLDIIKKKYPLSFMIEGKFKAFDIFIPELQEGVEVKSDRQAEDTGNVFIEIECNNQHSGIQTTMASWYVYKTTKRMFWANTQSIRRYLIQSAQRLKMFSNRPKGEVSAVRGYLVPIEDFEQLSRRTKL